MNVFAVLTRLRMHIFKPLVTVLILAAVSFGQHAGCTVREEGIEIQSCILRDRIIVMDQLIRKKALYLAFSRTHGSPQQCIVHGQMIYGGQVISRSSLQAFNGIHGSMFFDLPAEIPDGFYTIVVKLVDSNNRTFASTSKTFRREEFNSVFQKEVHVRQHLPRRVDPAVKNHDLRHLDLRESHKGYVVFQRSPLAYVYSGDIPQSNEIVRQVSVNVVKNEYENIPFSIFAFQDLGVTNIKLEWDDKDCWRINKNNIAINHIESVEDQRGIPEGTYRTLPSLIVPGASVKIEKGRAMRFWLTLHIPADADAGTWAASIVISPEKGPQTRLPLVIKINDITLEDIPGVHYFMLMTYEFTELVHNWSEGEKSLIYEHACQVLKDYKAHGMTALCPHSPFIPIEDGNGNLNLTDIKTALIAARDVGLQGPVIWYMGHLIQTPKPRHPGSILGFEPQKSYDVLEKLVRDMDRFALDNHCPQLVFLPIDEPDDKSQDFHGKRFDITNPLLDRIKSYGGMTAVTAVSYDTFRPKDFFLTSRYNQKDLQKARTEGCAYIEYNNDVTTQCTNPAYARYIYGYHTWQCGLNGMCSWTFQNTQAASGNPRLADSPGKDTYLAYPNPRWPLATLMWEAVREGIEDHKLVYQMEERMKIIQQNGHSAEKYQDVLDRVREKTISPDCSEGKDGGWQPEAFLQTKDDIIRLIMEADTLTRK